MLYKNRKNKVDGFVNNYLINTKEDQHKLNQSYKNNKQTSNSSSSQIDIDISLRNFLEHNQIRSSNKSRIKGDDMIIEDNYNRW